MKWHFAGRDIWPHTAPTTEMRQEQKWCVDYLRLLHFKKLRHYLHSGVRISDDEAVRRWGRS